MRFSLQELNRYVNANVQGVPKICPTFVFFLKWARVDRFWWNFTCVKKTLWEFLGYQNCCDILIFTEMGRIRKCAAKYRIAEQMQATIKIKKVTQLPLFQGFLFSALTQSVHHRCLYSPEDDVESARLSGVLRWTCLLLPRRSDLTVHPSRLVVLRGHVA